MDIGERISERRKELDISQNRLAELLGVTRQAVSKWENGTASPDINHMIMISDILNVDLEYLAFGKKQAMHDSDKSDLDAATMKKNWYFPSLVVLIALVAFFSGLLAGTYIY